LVRTLRLDRPDRVRQRRMIIETLSDIQKTGNAQRLRDWLGFPDDLDDLRKSPPPTNYRLEGIDESWFSRQKRGELPEIY
jgi:hypothetical protein